MNNRITIKCLLILSMMVFLTSNAFAKAKNDIPITTNSIQSSLIDTSIHLKVTEMSCKTDAKMVQTALYRKSGIKKVSIVDDIVSVLFNPLKISMIEIINTIENTGTCEDPNAKVHKVKFNTP